MKIEDSKIGKKVLIAILSLSVGIVASTIFTIYQIQKLSMLQSLEVNGKNQLQVSNNVKLFEITTDQQYNNAATNAILEITLMATLTIILSIAINIWIANHKYNIANHECSKIKAEGRSEIENSETQLTIAKRYASRIAISQAYEEEKEMYYISETENPLVIAKSENTAKICAIENLDLEERKAKSILQDSKKIEYEKQRSSEEEIYKTEKKSIQHDLEAIRIIARKIKVINSIAKETDILAINAAIESTIAGEHKKGIAEIAVVLRKLAEISQEASFGINNLTVMSLKPTDNDELHAKTIEPKTKETPGGIEEIGGINNESNNNEKKITEIVEQLLEVTEHYTATTEELTTSAQELSSQSEMLREIVSFFKTGKELKRYIARANNIQNNKGSIETGNNTRFNTNLDKEEFGTDTGGEFNKN